MVKCTRKMCFLQKLSLTKVEITSQDVSYVPFLFRVVSPLDVVCAVFLW